MDFIESAASRIRRGVAKKKHRANQKARKAIANAQRKQLGRKSGKKTGKCRRNKVILKKTVQRLPWKGKRSKT